MYLSEKKCGAQRFLYSMALILNLLTFVIFKQRPTTDKTVFFFSQSAYSMNLAIGMHVCGMPMNFFFLAFIVLFVHVTPFNTQIQNQRHKKRREKNTSN